MITQGDTLRLQRLVQCRRNSQGIENLVLNELLFLHACYVKSLLRPLHEQKGNEQDCVQLGMENKLCAGTEGRFAQLYSILKEVHRQREKDTPVFNAQAQASLTQGIDDCLDGELPRQASKVLQILSVTITILLVWILFGQDLL